MNNKKPNDSKKEKLQFIASIALVTILVAAIIGCIIYINNNKVEKEEKELPYTELIKEISNKNVEKIEMTVGSTTVKVTLKGMEEGEEKTTIVPSTQVFMELIQAQTLEGNEIEVKQNPQSILALLPSYFFTLLPTILIVIMFGVVFKMQGIGDKGEIYDETERKIKTTFDDVAGLDEEKEELIEIVDFLKKPEKFIEMGAKIPKGVLLYGKPGTGKTLIAKAIAGEAGVPFISMSGSEFIEMFAGLGASRVRKLFDKARKLAPCIVFIDEIDAIGARRKSNNGAESENNQTLNQL